MRQAHPNQFLRISRKMLNHLCSIGLDQAQRMLDEVDAPLDDANVGRFCELVKSMSERVQFIFITHNKVTMEMANQLTGVTMNEPGVSRLVAVDVDAAVEMAEM